MKTFLYFLAILLFVIKPAGANPVPGEQAKIQKKKIYKDKPLKNLAMNTKKGKWQVWGSIMDQKRKGIPGLYVYAYDKDLTFDDLLGRAKTNNKGQFIIYYDDKDFKELTEKTPDLYIIVKNQKNKTMYSSKNNIRYNAKRVEKYDVMIKIFFLRPIKPFIKKKK